MTQPTVPGLIAELRRVESDLRNHVMISADAQPLVRGVLLALREQLPSRDAWQLLTLSEQNDVVAVAAQFAPFLAEGSQLRCYLVEELGVPVPLAPHEPGYRASGSENTE